MFLFTHHGTNNLSILVKNSTNVLKNRFFFWAFVFTSKHKIFFSKKRNWFSLRTMFFRKQRERKFKGKKCGHKVVELCLSYLTPPLNGYSTQTFLPFYQTQSLSHPVMLLTLLMSPWHVKALVLLLSISWRGCLCCWCQNKTEAMLLMLVKKHGFDAGAKKYVVEARTKQRPFCWCKICNMNLLKL